MTELYELRQFPRDIVSQLAPYAKADWQSLGLGAFGAVAMANKLWLVAVRGTPVLYAGLFGGSGPLAGTPEFWLLLCKDFMKHKRDAVRAVQQLRPLLPPCRARVSTQFPVGVRFAEHFGFREVARDETYVWLEG